MNPIRVLLVEDHTIFRETVRGQLDREPDIAVIGEAEDGRAAIEETRRLAPDVVVMDVVMPSLNGIDSSRAILRERPGVKIVVLSMYGKPSFVREVLAAGASAYLLKDCTFSELVHAIRVTAGGPRVYLSPAVAQVVVAGYVQPADAAEAAGAGSLTSREREVLQLVAEGGTSASIAAMLGVSTRTVENHRARVMRKLGASSVAELVRYAIREGLTPL